MARIKKYVNDDNISEYDTVIGSDAESLNGTKNYSMASILKFLKAGFNPETGGDLSIRELSYTGSTYTTPHAYLNSLDPYITILQYDVVIVNINETKYLLKKQDITVGFEQTPLLSSDFILIKEPQINSDWNSTSGFSKILNKPVYIVPTLDTVLGAGYTSNKQILLSDFGASANFNNYQLQLTDNTNKSFTLQSNALVSRDSTQNSTFLQLPVNALNNVVYKTPLKSAGTYTLATTAEIIAYDGSETKINQGTNINVTGSGTVASPYVVSLPASASWLPGDTKEVVCDDTYRSANFDSNGLGRLERLGWAIMNGNTHIYNGVSVTVPNDNGKVVIAYGSSYTTLGATGGAETHKITPAESPALINSTKPYQTGSTSNDFLSPITTNDAMSIMQPYVVRLRIVKL